jgi:hypothetical protein
LDLSLIQLGSTGTYREGSPEPCYIGLAPVETGDSLYLYRIHTMTNRRKPGCVFIKLKKLQSPADDTMSPRYKQAIVETGDIAFIGDNARLDPVMSQILPASAGYTTMVSQPHADNRQKRKVLSEGEEGPLSAISSEASCSYSPSLSRFQRYLNLCRRCKHSFPNCVPFSFGWHLCCL